MEKPDGLPNRKLLNYKDCKSGIATLHYSGFPQGRFSFLIRENQQRGSQFGGLGVTRQSGLLPICPSSTQ
jgi:hypothetical protein